MFGSVIMRKSCQGRAPRLTAAISSSAPSASMSGISSRATTGKVTKHVAITSPGNAKTILMSCSRSHGPKKPCSPKSSSRKRPTTTGDTVNGRSISAVRNARPGNLKRAIAHAAARPKITFRMTAVGATIKREQDRVQRVGVADEVLPVGAETGRERLDEDVHQRHDDQQRS